MSVAARRGARRSRVVAAALFPVLIALVLAYVAYFTESGLGAGEKDALLAVPAVLWSVVFAASLLVFARVWSLGRATLAAACLSLLVLAAVAYAFLSYAGRGAQPRTDQALVWSRSPLLSTPCA